MLEKHWRVPLHCESEHFKAPEKCSNGDVRGGAWWTPGPHGLIIIYIICRYYTVIPYAFHSGLHFVTRKAFPVRL